MLYHPWNLFESFIMVDTAIDYMYVSTTSARIALEVIHNSVS